MFEIGSFFRKLKRAFQYAVFVMKDGQYDWDYDFLLSLMHFKMKRMHDCFRDNDIVIDWQLKEMLSSLNECCDILEKLRYEYFEMSDLKEIEEKHGEFDFSSNNNPEWVRIRDYMEERFFWVFRKNYRGWWD